MQVHTWRRCDPPRRTRRARAAVAGEVDVAQADWRDNAVAALEFYMLTDGRAWAGGGAARVYRYRMVSVAGSRERTFCSAAAVSGRKVGVGRRGREGGAAWACIGSSVR